MKMFRKRYRIAIIVAFVMIVVVGGADAHLSRDGRRYPC
jgi:hypothetical protein